MNPSNSLASDSILEDAASALGLAPAGPEQGALFLAYRQGLLRDAVADCRAAGISLSAIAPAHREIARAALRQGPEFTDLSSFSAVGSPEERIRGLSMAKALAEAAVDAISEAAPALASAPAGVSGPRGPDTWIVGSPEQIARSANPFDPLPSSASVRQSVERFADALFSLPEPAISFGLDHLKASMSETFPSLTVGSPSRGRGRVLGTANKEALLGIFAERPAWSEELRALSINSISDADKFNPSRRPAP